MPAEIRTPISLGRLDGLLGFHLRMASAVMARDFAAAMGPLDLTQKQVAVLELIDANANVSQVDLAEALGTDRATMMAIVDRLEQRDLLARSRSPLDGRRQVLSLTPTGTQTIKRARKLIAEHEQRMRRSIGEDAVGALIETLRRFEGR